MLKFFRKIRQNLLMENKTGKYLKYAIGEILLVIIGILIAVSINGWNEDRKIILEEQAILKDLKQEVSTNLKALEFVIAENEKSFEAATAMKALFKNRAAFTKMSSEQFNTLLENTNWNVTYDPQYGILNSIISSGHINHISDNELKYLLASIKETTIDALENSAKIEAQRDDLMKTCWTDAAQIENKKITGFQVKSIFDCPEFRWAINHLFIWQRRDGLEEEKELKKTLLHIMELIDKNTKN